MKIIVLDTNIWLSELALMSPLGCALNHYITVSGHKIGLPEIIEEETKHNFHKKLIEYRTNIEKDYERLLAIFGKMNEIVMPSNEEIKSKVEAIFDFHRDSIYRMPFTIEGARSSLDKIYKKEPPNCENNQQFKDGVIWANCLDLAASYEVLFVTEDKGFFKQRTYEKGLAENLLAEANNTGHEIHIFHEISELLHEIKSPTPLDEQQLIKLTEQMILDKLNKLCEEEGFHVEKLLTSTFEAFATTKPKEVSITFSLRYALENKSAKYRDQAQAQSRGEILLVFDSYEVKSFRNNGADLFWRDQDGVQTESGITYGSIGNIGLGRKMIEHRIHYKLS